MAISDLRGLLQRLICVSIEFGDSQGKNSRNESLLNYCTSKLTYFLVTFLLEVVCGFYDVY